MSVKLLTEYLLEVLSLKGGCTGSSESTLVKKSNYQIIRTLMPRLNYSFLAALGVKKSAKYQMFMCWTKFGPRCVFGVSNKSRLKPGSSATETC